MWTRGLESRRHVVTALGSSTTTLTGLDFNGNPTDQRSILWADVSSLPAYPCTLIWKVFQRNQVTNRPDHNRYYVNNFRGNNGRFDWGTGWESSYYGFHPYPVPPDLLPPIGPPGDGKFEVSADAGDRVTMDDNSEPFVTNGRWYDQAAVCTSSGGTLQQIYYTDLANVSTATTITHTQTGPRSTPPSDCIIWAQAPDNGSGQSWGGYDQWEENNAIHRGIQIYSSAISLPNIQGLRVLETDAAVLSYNSSHSITTLWYLNMNWKLLDLLDKSGGGHHAAFQGIGRPTQVTV